MGMPSPAGAYRPRSGSTAGLSALAAIAVLVLGALLIVASRPPAVPPPSPRGTAEPATDAPLAPVDRVDLVLPLGDRAVRLEVVDRTGMLTGAFVATSRPAGTVAPALGPFELDIQAVPGDERGVWVGWQSFGCEHRGRLTIEADRRTLSLEYAPSPGCDALGFPQGLLLQFKAPIDASSLRGGEVPSSLVAVGDLRPFAVAFADDGIGWIGGTTPHDDALVLHTADGGSTWAMDGAGDGGVIEIAAIEGDRALLTRECGPQPFNCIGGTFRWGDGGVDAMAGVDRLVAIDFEGGLGAAVAIPADGGAPEVRRNDDGAATEWQTIPDPCERPTELPADVDRSAPDSLLVLCLGIAAAGGQTKTLYEGDAGGAKWTAIASSGDGTLPFDGTGASLDIAADGTGWLWVGRTGLLATGDAGRSWTPLRPPLGAARLIVDASHLGGEQGVVLVDDQDRFEAILLRTKGGAAWEEIGAWPYG